VGAGTGFEPVTFRL